MTEKAPRLRVLLLDDETSLLQLLTRYLTRLGYDVEGFSRGREALAAFEARPGDFAIAMVDLTLQDMPGEQVVRRMLDISADARILVCSGYPFSVESLPDEVQNRVGYLQKPFLPRMLVAAIEELTGAAPDL
jgi:two-component system, cell cycle sensor histidine kinase and response regulator CckA